MFVVSWECRGERVYERCRTFESALLCFLTKRGSFPNVDVTFVFFPDSK